MQCERPGTHRRRKELLQKHYELMERYVAEGMTREDASKKAFYEVRCSKHLTA